MRTIARLPFWMLFVAFFAVTPSYAQVPEDIQTESTEETGEDFMDAYRPMNDVVDKKTFYEKRVLPYDFVRESDVLWKKIVWRVIDTREKLNLPFVYPNMPLMTIIMRGLEEEKITAYMFNDTTEFFKALTQSEVLGMTNTVDTVVTTDPETYETIMKPVYNTLNPLSIRRYRIKELWYFDKETSNMEVRLLGIAPMIAEELEGFEDPNNAFAAPISAERPMFWLYYPDCRDYFGRFQAFNEGNDASVMSWEDLFEIRLFSSYIFKVTNVYNRRLQDYLSGTNLLLEGEKIKAEIFNFENDLWQY